MIEKSYMKKILTSALEKLYILNTYRNCPYKKQIVQLTGIVKFRFVVL